MVYLRLNGGSDLVLRECELDVIIRRAVRWEPVDEVRNVRIVGDVSSVEVFVNDGALVFSTRMYPEAYGVSVDAPGADVNYHTLSL